MSPQFLILRYVRIKMNLIVEGSFFVVSSNAYFPHLVY
jgi:hypothetical protein